MNMRSRFECWRDGVRPSASPASEARIGVFISIPRNASTSLRRILRLGPNRDLERTNSLVVHENHCRGERLAERYDLAKLFSFCFVRHPYGRCQSWFAFHRRLEPYASLSFHDWVAEGMPHHWRVQNGSDYRVEGRTPLLQSTFLPKAGVDFVGRLEHFERDLGRIVERLNGDAASSGHRRRFRVRSLRENMSARDEAELDSASKRRIRSLLAADFESFDYDA